MKINIKRTGGAFGMQAETENGHKVLMDTSAANGGNGSGASPMQLVLVAAGGCSTIDIIDILKKQREPLEDINVEVTGTRAESVPKVFTSIHLDYALTGSIDPQKAVRAIKLSIEKYCSVLLMLEKAAEISWSATLNGEKLTKQAD